MTTNYLTKDQVLQLGRKHWHRDKWNGEYFDVYAFYLEAYDQLKQVSNSLDTTVKEQAEEIASLKEELIKSADEIKVAIDESRAVLVDEWSAKFVEQAAEIERLKLDLLLPTQTQLATAQLHIKRLREAGEKVTNTFATTEERPRMFACHHTETTTCIVCECAVACWEAMCDLRESLSAQPDTSALEAERQRVADACAIVIGQFFPDSRLGARLVDRIRAGQWRNYLSKE